MEFSAFSCLIFCSVGAFLFWLVYTWRLGSFRQHALQIVLQAEQEAKLKSATLDSEFQKACQKKEQEIKDEQLNLEGLKRQYKTKLQQYTRDTEQLKKDQTRLIAWEQDLKNKEQTIDKLCNEAKIAVEKASHLSYEEARSTLLTKAKEEAHRDIERQKEEWQRAFESDCKERALCLLLGAIERKTQALTKEFFITDIPLEDRSSIPKFIGKDGRNIQMLESLLDVCCIVEENPPRLLLSSHDPKARFIAKATVEYLIKDDKITPVTIRSAHEKAIESFSRLVTEQGRSALRGCKTLTSLPNEVLFSLGNLSFRSSNGQNVLAHSIEVAEMMGILASELGLHRETATVIGLLHDIGKGLSTEWGESHALAGERFLKRWGIDSTIGNAVASHHGEVLPSTNEALLLPVCDRLSAQLPGIRNTKEPPFLALVRTCESRTQDIPGVISSWAHYAGNHLELIIRHSSDANTATLLRSVRDALQMTSLPLPVTITLLGAKSDTAQRTASQADAS